MGLDFSHCPTHWTYHGFHDFRIRLAKLIGVDFEKDDTTNLDDPIAPLLNHSDCDGELSPEECRLVAPRLRELAYAWSPDDPDRQSAFEMAVGMQLAAAENEPFVFW